MRIGLKWHAVWQGTLASYTSLCASAALGQFLAPRTVGLLIAVGAAAQVGTVVYYASANRVMVPSPPVEAGSGPAT